MTTNADHDSDMLTVARLLSANLAVLQERVAVLEAQLATIPWDEIDTLTFIVGGGDAQERVCRWLDMAADWRAAIIAASDEE